MAVGRLGTQEVGEDLHGRAVSLQAAGDGFVEGAVHHATIFEMNVESYRRRAALQRQST